MAPDGSITERLNISTWEQDQLQPDLAFNGDDYLVAWSDRRHSWEQIYYTIVPDSGPAPDTVGIRLACQDTAMFQFSPAVASGESGFLIAWLSGRSLGVVVQAVRLGPDGTLLDSVPIDFTGDTLFQNRVQVGTDGHDYLVVWCGEEPGGIGQSLFCSRVDASGTKLDSVPVLVCSTTEGLFDPAVAFLNDRYLVVWCDQRKDFDIYAARILPDGTLLDPGGFPVARGLTDQREPSVASVDERFFVTWSEQETTDYDVYAAFVDTSGAVVGLSGGELKPPRNQALRLEALPNPCRTEVGFRLTGPCSKPSAPSPLLVFNSAGRLVRTLGTEDRTTDWNMRDGRDIIVPAGVYVARCGNASCRFVVLDR